MRPLFDLMLFFSIARQFVQACPETLRFGRHFVVIDFGVVADVSFGRVDFILEDFRFVGWRVIMPRARRLERLQDAFT